MLAAIFQAYITLLLYNPRLQVQPDEAVEHKPINHMAL